MKSVGELPASGQRENDVTERHDLASIAQTQTASIQTVIDLIRSAPFPMFILLGQDRRLIYNDAYVPVLGARHPAAMEKPFFEVWPEVRSVVEPVIERAFVGEPSHFEDLPVVLHRPDPEPAWFTFSYSPIRNEKSDIVGTLCICTETTEAVTARERQTFLISLEMSFRGIDDPFQIIETAQAALGTYLGVSRVGYGTVDDTGRYFTTKRNWSDGSVQNEDGTHDLTAFGNTIFDALRRGIPSKITDTWTDPREGAEGAAAAFAALHVRSAVTVPLIKGDRFVAALYVHHREPRQWTEGDLTLIRDVAERTWSAVERAYAQADLHALSRRQAFLLRLSDQLRPLASAEQIKETAARLIGEHLHVGRAGYGEIDAAQEHVTVERDWSDGEMGSLAGETRPLNVFGPAIIAELKAGRLLRLDSVAENRVSAPYAPGYASIGTRSLLVVPLLKDRRLVAIFYLHEPDVRTWTDEEAAITFEVAERTWATVERAHAENAVRELNATLEHRVNFTLAERGLYAGIVEATDAPIQMIDGDYRFLAINPAAQADYQRVYGVRPHVGDCLMDLLAHVPDQRDEARAVWSRALSGEAIDQNAWWGKGDLDRRAYEMRFRPVRDADEQITGAYLIGRDVTDLLKEQDRLLQAEEQLRQAQKMEAIGQLTGGVAHDFNNLLTPIVGTLDMLQRKQLGGDREQRMIAGAAQAAERARVLIQRLLAFARRQPLQPMAVDIKELVQGMAELITSTTGPQIHVAVEIAARIPAAWADRNQLEMALLNLAVNARDAMPAGGTLRISADSSESTRSPPELPPDDYVRISVADTGVGMDEQTLKRAIEPFFSTKGVGKGTGLGLSMVHGLALQLGGTLTIKSRQGVGTNVELWLPICSSLPKADERESKTATIPSARGKVLLVDDEEVVRISTAEILHDLGYEVTEAGSAREAMQQITGGLLPDLLVTDHLMAGVTGTELARSVVRSHPKVQVLIISGYSEVDEIATDLPRLQSLFERMS